MKKLFLVLYRATYAAMCYQDTPGLAEFLSFVRWWNNAISSNLKQSQITDWMVVGEGLNPFGQGKKTKANICTFGPHCSSSWLVLKYRVGGCGGNQRKLLGRYFPALQMLVCRKDQRSFTIFHPRIIFFGNCIEKLKFLPRHIEWLQTWFLLIASFSDEWKKMIYLPS